MFNVQIRPETLETFIDAPMAFVDESKVRLTEDAMKICACDPANVAMADITLAKEGTESYHADDGVLGVDLDRLDDVSSLSSTGDLIEISLNEDTRKLDIDVGGVEYTKALIDPDMIRAEPDIPDLDLPATVTLRGEQLDQLVTAADMVSDHIRLGMTDEGRFRAAADGDTDSVEQEFGEHDVEALTPGSADTLLSLDYVRPVASMFDDNDHVTIQLGEEMPAWFEATLLDGHANVLFMIAPRIDAE